MKKMICPCCMDEKEVKVVKIEDSITVKEDVVKVTTPVVICQTCFTEFNNSEVPATAIEEAFKVYRQSHNLLTPEQIKYYRLAFNYSLMDLSKKTNINPEWIEMLERGAIHSKHEDYELRKVFGV